MRLEKLQDLVSTELADWIATWDEVKVVVGVSNTADQGRVMAALKALKREVEELKAEQDEMAKHAGFSSAGRLWQHFKTQPAGFLTGKVGAKTGVVLPDELLSPNAYWFKATKEHKAISQLQVDKWLRQVQQVAKQLLTERPELRDEMVEHYKEHHPTDFLEACRKVMFGEAVKAEKSPGDRRQLSLMLPGMTGFQVWVPREEDQAALMGVSLDIWSDETDAKLYVESEKKLNPDLWRLGHWVMVAAEDALYGGPNDETCLMLPNNWSRKSAWEELWEKEDRVVALTMVRDQGLGAVEDWVEARAVEIEEEES